MKSDVYHDTVCPSCRISKSHLLQTLEQTAIEPVAITYRGFLSDPTTPAEGRPQFTLIERLGGKARSDGLDVAEVEAHLRAQEKLPEVERDFEFAQAANISGVPFFIFNDQYALSGAQPVEVFVEVLKQIDEQALSNG
ncbi:MAG: DsbA family protein [Alicyclobacillus sp.]|nr:DsbA family protein [Alicyclobacillus sp.]